MHKDAKKEISIQNIRTMDILKSLEIFKKVADFQSFSRAANDLETPKSAVSAQIAKLETNLGVRLFNRTTRHVSLSQNGRDFYEIAQRLLFDADEALNYFKHNNEKIQGILRVDMPLGMASNLIIPKLADFIAIYPNLSLDLSSTDRVVDVVNEGFDCVIRVGLQHNLGLGNRVIGQMPIVNLASAEYLQKYGEINELSDLKNHYLVDYDTEFGASNSVFEYQEGNVLKSVAMNSKIRVNNSTSYQSACIAGFGIIQTPMAGLLANITNSKLRRILSNYEPKPLNITLLTPTRRNIPLRTQVFIDWVESLMPEYCTA